MYPVLKSTRVIEGASFIAAPYCGLMLAQLGAEVIRFDTIGGGPDFNRWPQAENGASLYWEGLNKSKKSIAIELSSPEGRELAVALITAPGPGAGIFVTNYPASGFLAHTRLAALRPDLLSARIMGHADGSSALDYTINCAVGLPLMTGPAEKPELPVNHVLPAWDLLAGSTAATALMAGLVARSLSGEGQEISVPLSDVAYATLGHLGQVAEVLVNGGDRPKIGNNLFGAFGRDFTTRDGKRVMIVGLTPRQWSGLIKALDLQAEIAAIESEQGVSFRTNEGNRYVHRDRLNAVVAKAVSVRDAESLQAVFDANGVCWGPYRTLAEAVSTDPAFTQRNPVFSEIAHPSGHSYPTPGFAATFQGLARNASGRAPRFGEHTDEVLANVLGMSGQKIGRLHDRHVVQGA